MEAIFINPLPKGKGLNDATIEPPLGLAYLASTLEQHGFTCSVIDANALGIDSQQLLPQISRQASLIGIYLNSFNYNSVLELTQLCRKQRPEATMVLGGPLASAAPAMALSEIPCHGLVQGEGEDAIVAIMSNLASGRPPFDSEIPGVAYHDTSTGNVVINPVARIMDLDRLPFSAYQVYQTHPPRRVSHRELLWRFDVSALAPGFNDHERHGADLSEPGIHHH